jgi:hypothetical protein
MPIKRDCDCCGELDTCIERGTLCPECHRTGFYYRKKTDDYRCPHCEHIWSNVHEVTEGPQKERMNDKELMDALWDVAERLGYSNQEPGYQPVLIFVEDDLFELAMVKKGKMSYTQYFTDFINRAIDCGGLD